MNILKFNKNFWRSVKMWMLSEVNGGIFLGERVGKMSYFGKQIEGHPNGAHSVALSFNALPFPTLNVPSYKPRALLPCSILIGQRACWHPPWHPPWVDCPTSAS